jgi:hypothetical protein
VLAIERIMDIQLVQILEQPIAIEGPREKIHPTESKTFARSIFNMTRGFLLDAKAFAVHKTQRKLS